MKLLGIVIVMLLGMGSVLGSCSAVNRGSRAIVVSDQGSMRYVNGKKDKVHKKWSSSSSYKPRNNKVAKRRTADW